MFFLASIIILILFWFIGKAVIQVFQFTKSKHPIFYGFLTYTSLFFVLTAIFVVINVSWLIYFSTMLLYTLALFGMSLYILIKNKFWLQINLKKAVVDNWPYVVTALCFFTLYLFSKGTEYIFASYGGTPVGIDNHVYLSRAAQGIGQAHIRMTEHDTMIKNNPSSLTTIIGFWEYFWAFGAEAFRLNLLTFVHSVLPAVIHFVVIAGIDELFYVFSNKKHQHLMKYAVLALLALLVFNNMQFEAIKFMVYPWFGNVLVSTLFLPTVFIFLYHALQNRKLIILLLLLPLYFIGFNPIAILFAACTYPVITFLLFWQQKPLQTSDKIWIALFCLGIIGFFCIAGLQGRLSYWRNFSDLLTDNLPANAFERQIFQGTLSIRDLFFFASFIGYIYRASRTKMSMVEKVGAGYLFFMIIISLVPYITYLPFNLFNFIYARYLHAILFLAIPYGVVGLLLLLSTLQWKTNFAILCSILLVMHARFDWFIPSFPEFFSSDMIFSAERVEPSALALANKLKEIPGEKAICFVPGSLHTYKEIEKTEVYIDYLNALMGMDANNYLVEFCYDQKEDVVYLDSANYVVIINSIGKESLLRDHDVTFIFEIKENDITLDVYAVND